MNELPKVLVVGINAWREDAPAHTLMQIFSCWDPKKLSMVYTKADLPDTTVCHRFFQISENDVLKSVFRPSHKTGREVFNTPQVDKALVEEEHTRYKNARKRHRNFLVICREIVWALGHWKSKKLKAFIESVQPDLLFFPVYPVIYMGWVQRYIYRICKKPMVCYLGDDNYSYYACKGILSYVHRFFLRSQVKWLSNHCQEMFVIVDKEKEETDRLFGTNSVILTKGLDFGCIQYEHQKPQKPITFVYTGSLIIDRDKTLALIADIINDFNVRGFQAQLKIYSPDMPDEHTLQRLNRGCSQYCGFAPRDQISLIQKAADVVVFAEALHGHNSLAARLSFSTKITDYLASGKCILAVGRRDIAPIDYFVRNKAALVASDEEELRKQILWIIEHPGEIDIYGQRAFACAMRNHEQGMINKRFIETMKRAAKGN